MIVAQYPDYYVVNCSCGESYYASYDENCKTVDSIPYPQCPSCLRLEGLAFMTSCDHEFKQIKHIDDNIQIIACRDCGDLFKKIKFISPDGDVNTIYLGKGESDFGFNFSVDEVNEILGA